MFLVWRDENCVPRLDFFFVVLVSHFPGSFEYVDFMFPVVAMKGSMAVRLNREMAHEKGGCSVFLVDEPLYCNSLGAFFRHCGNGRRVYANPTQAESLSMKSNYKINGAAAKTSLECLKFQLLGRDLNI